MQTSAATAENVWRFLEKLKGDLPSNPASPLLGIFLKKPEPLIQRMCAPLCSLQSYLWEPRFGSRPSVHQWMDKKLWYMHTMEYCWARKEGNFIFHNSMGQPRGCYAKWNKPVRERQIPYHLTYMWNVKNNLNEKTGRKQSHSYREQSDGCQSGEGLGD